MHNSVIILAGVYGNKKQYWAIQKEHPPLIHMCDTLTNRGTPQALAEECINLNCIDFSYPKRISKIGQIRNWKVAFHGLDNDEVKAFEETIEEIILKLNPAIKKAADP